jgi:hypothetical protein
MEQEPAIAVRLVTTVGETTRRVDVAIAGEESVAVEDGATTVFPTARLWPVVRELLPPLPHVQADPAGRVLPEPREPGPDFVEQCRAFVAVTTVVDESVTVRSWLATDDELWSVTPQPDGSTVVRPAADGAIADLLVWDVTAALEALLHRYDRKAS